MALTKAFYSANSLEKSLLDELFYYADGRLFNKISRGPRARAGELAGSYDAHGYRCVEISEKKYKVHRLIYVMHYGVICDGLDIDHINGVRDDNRIENLRLVERVINTRNVNTVKGYTKKDNRYHARICTDKGRIHLGSFKSPEEARAAYVAAKKKYHGMEIEL